MHDAPRQTRQGSRPVPHLQERLHRAWGTYTRTLHAYRASNKRDYVIQMVTWLQRQEAVDRFAAYLEWRSPSRPSSNDSHTISRRIIPQSSTFGRAPRVQSHMSLHPPRELQHVEASQIISQHGASEFLFALQHFLRANGCSIIPQTFDTFHLFKRIVFELPKIAETSSNHCHDVVRAAPPIPQQGRRPAQAGCFDFALIRTREINPHTENSPLAGKYTCAS